jgi:hypothetical protein
MSGILGSELGVIKKQYVHYANSENSRILNLVKRSAYVDSTANVCTTL